MVYGQAICFFNAISCFFQSSSSISKIIFSILYLSSFEVLFLFLSFIYLLFRNKRVSLFLNLSIFRISFPACFLLFLSHFHLSLSHPVSWVPFSTTRPCTFEKKQILSCYFHMYVFSAQFIGLRGSFPQRPYFSPSFLVLLPPVPFSYHRKGAYLSIKLGQ